MTSLPRLLFSGLLTSLALAILLVAGRARADRVLVLPFAGGGATSTMLAEVKNATAAAAVQLGHSLPGDSEVLTGQMAVGDGTADTSQEYRAAGRASGSQWTVTGHVDPREGFYRLELDACQVESGRVESLAREIDPPQATTQIAEMLALLLRPAGIGSGEIRWATHPPKPPAPPPKPPAPPVPPPPPPPPAVRHAYAEGHPLAVGVGMGVLNALVRPDVARGPSWAMTLSGVFGYAIESVPGLELRGNLAGAVAGPRSLDLNAGARYAIGVLPTLRVFIGPELGLGTFVTFGAEKTARFLAHGAAFAAVGLGERVQIEIAGDLSYAAGGSGPLVLGGGTARGLLRF